MRNLCEREDITAIVGEEMGNSLVAKRVGSCVVKKTTEKGLINDNCNRSGECSHKQSYKKDENFKKYLV